MRDKKKTSAVEDNKNRCVWNRFKAGYVFQQLFGMDEELCIIYKQNIETYRDLSF